MSDLYLFKTYFPSFCMKYGCENRGSKYCGKCGSVRLGSYCSVDCQQADWSTHKSFCELQAENSPSYTEVTAKLENWQSQETPEETVAQECEQYITSVLSTIKDKVENFDEQKLFTCDDANLYIYQLELCFLLLEKSAVPFNDVFKQLVLDMIEEMGGLFLTAEDMDEAQRLFRKAVNVAKSIFPRDDTKLDACYNRILRRYRKQERFDRKIILRWIDEAIKVKAKVYGEESVEMADLLDYQARAHEDLAKHRDELRVVERTLKMRRRLNRLRTREHARGLTLKAYALAHIPGRRNDARQCYQEALEIQKELGGAKNRRVVHLYMMLARLKRDDDDLAGALRLYGEAQRHLPNVEDLPKKHKYLPYMVKSEIAGCNLTCGNTRAGVLAYTELLHEVKELAGEGSNIFYTILTNATMLLLNDPSCKAINKRMLEELIDLERRYPVHGSRAESKRIIPMAIMIWGSY